MAPKKRPASCDADASHDCDPELEHEIAHSIPTSMTFKGLNVKEHFAVKLMDGSKSVEIRKYPLGSRGTSAQMFIVATKGQGKKHDPNNIGAEVLGVAIFDPTMVEYMDAASFRNDYYRHGVLEGNEFGFKGSKLYGWVVKRAIPFTQRIPARTLPKRSMIGWSKEVTLTALLLPFWVGEFEDVVGQI